MNLKETNNIENAILASFLYADKIGFDKKEVYILDTGLFNSPLKRNIADIINAETMTDKFYEHLLFTVGLIPKNTEEEKEWIDIKEQAPIRFDAVRKYCNLLESRSKQKEK